MPIDIHRDIDEGIIQGSCLFGVVEFRVEGIFPKTYQCHCSLCRKQGGESSSLAILVEARNFSRVTGREHISSYVRPTGFRSDFCAKCARVIRLPGHRFRAELSEEVKPVRDADGQIDIQGTMQAATSVIEGWIREYPDQWLWLHRRWR